VGVSWLSPRLFIDHDSLDNLRTSMQGASQAIEDGVTLAVALKMAGKDKVPLAARAWEGIR
jgi:hypothetical protein